MSSADISVNLHAEVNKTGDGVSSEYFARPCAKLDGEGQ